MSDLNNQLNKYTSLLYEKIIEILNYIASLYDLTVSKFNFDTSIINESISQITKFFVNIYKIVIERLNLEFNDIKLIYNSFVSSLSANGQIAALFILVLIIFFIFKILVYFIVPIINQILKQNIKKLWIIFTINIV